MQVERIFPFLWIRANEKDKLEEEINAIKDSGFNAFCVESRVHEDFLGTSWWEDFDEIVRLAKERGMQVWILDDRSYPTGFANGAYTRQENASLRARHIKVEAVDVVGPSNVRLPVSLNAEFDEKLIGIALFRRTANGVNINDMRFLPQPRGRFVSAEVPRGSWRCLYFVDTQAGYERQYFCDPLNDKSTDLLIKTVYEPFFERYGKDFGKTVVGFFTDEPRFCNGPTGYGAWDVNMYRNTLGHFGMAYPWKSCFFDSLFDGDMKKLCALWFDVGAETADLRVKYMRAVTNAYAHNFCGRLAEWCHAHGILYAGHIIEDMGAHARLGCSAGNYFLSQYGADFASVDVVLHQIKPYETQTPFFAPIAGGKADPTFFNYTLAKLASSAAAIDPKKKGALCEIFGAYGWGESVRDMRWLFYHFLSRGVTAFIPHAFSMQENDSDCPPHFYMRGKNPAFGGIKILFREMAERCEYLSECHRVASVAVLYHAEAEWSGKPYKPVDEVNRVLTQGQTDFDIIPEYVLAEISFTDGGFMIGGNLYKKLVIPKFAYISEETKKATDELRRRGFLIEMKSTQLENLCEILRKDGINDIMLKTREKDLRVTHWKKDGKDVYMLFNEGKKTIKSGFVGGSDFTIEGGGVRFLHSLQDDVPAPKKVSGTKVVEFDAFVRSSDSDEFKFFRRVETGFDINDENGYADFCGFVRFDAEIDAQGDAEITVEYDGEWCEVKTENGTAISIDGICVCRVSGGKQKISVTLCNGFAYKFDDAFTHFNSVEKLILKDVRVRSLPSIA